MNEIKKILKCDFNTVDAFLSNIFALVILSLCDEFVNIILKVNRK